MCDNQEGAQPLSLSGMNLVMQTFLEATHKAIDEINKKETQVEQVLAMGQYMQNMLLSAKLNLASCNDYLADVFRTKLMESSEEIEPGLHVASVTTEELELLKLLDERDGKDNKDGKDSSF